MDFISRKTKFYLHGHIEEEREQKLVVDGHGNESGFVEFRGRLSDDDAQPDAPNQEGHLHWIGKGRFG